MQLGCFCGGSRHYLRHGHAFLLISNNSSRRVISRKLLVPSITVKWVASTNDIHTNAPYYPKVRSKAHLIVPNRFPNPRDAFAHLRLIRLFHFHRPSFLRHIVAATKGRVPETQIAPRRRTLFGGRLGR